MISGNPHILDFHHGVKTKTLPIWGFAAMVFLLTLSLNSSLWAEDFQDLQVVIKDYFEAEMSKNADQIWNLLAPSSTIKRFYPYENFLEMVRLNPVRLLGYELKFPPKIEENPDKENWPNVEKMASITIKQRLQAESGKESDQVSVFIFIFENGRWYKE